MIWLNLQALHLICWCVEQPRTYLFVFQIHWCLLPETLNTLLKPAQHWLVGHLPLVCWMVLLDSDIQQQLLKVPIQCCENIQPLLLLWCIGDPFLCFIDDIEAFHCSLPCKWYALSWVKAYIIFFFFFFEEFSPSLLILSLLNSFFLCINRWFLLFSPSLRNQGYYFAKGLSQSLLAYFVKFSVDLCPKVFHLLLCLFGNLFSQPVLLFDFKHL